VGKLRREESGTYARKYKPRLTDSKKRNASVIVVPRITCRKERKREDGFSGVETSTNASKISLGSAGTKGGGKVRPVVEANEEGEERRVARWGKRRGERGETDRGDIAAKGQLCGILVSTERIVGLDQVDSEGKESGRKRKEKRGWAARETAHAEAGGKKRPF